MQKTASRKKWHLQVRANEKQEAEKSEGFSGSLSIKFTTVRSREWRAGISIFLIQYLLLSEGGRVKKWPGGGCRRSQIAVQMRRDGWVGEVAGETSFEWPKTTSYTEKRGISRGWRVNYKLIWQTAIAFLVDFFSHNSCGFFLEKIPLFLLWGVNEVFFDHL